tara:strand:- start:22587 stop:23816 length:1230 start_codon:yes stop_codon:yes gene_type:complete
LINQSTKIYNFFFYFKLYLIFLGIAGVYHLYYKHNGGLDSTISEWMVNYKGGFTRRGLTGEIFIFFSNKLDLPIRFIIFLFQSLFYGIFLTLTFYFFKKIKKINYILLLIIFCPLFLIYHVAELEILARKEILIFSHFYVYLFFLEKKNNPNLSNFYLLLTLPILSLIWEPIIFFIPFYVFCFASRYVENIKKFKPNLLLNHFYSYSIFFIVLYFIISQDYTTNNEKLMCSYLKLNFNENCYMSLNYLDTSIKENFNSLFRDIKYSYVLRYSLVLLIGFFPLFLLLKNSIYHIGNKEINIFKIFIILILPILVLYMMGLDWGRWTNISYFYFIISTFFLIHINKIKLNYKKLDLITKKYFSTKTILILFFIIFCFGWNTKTLYKGDIASIPGYRVPYFLIKTIVNNFKK